MTGKKKLSRTTPVKPSRNFISAMLSAEEGLEMRNPSSTLSPAGTVTILLLLGGRGCAREGRGEKARRKKQAKANASPPSEGEAKVKRRLCRCRRRSFHRHLLSSLRSPPGLRSRAAASDRDGMGRCCLQHTEKSSGDCGELLSSNESKKEPLFWAPGLLGRKMEEASALSLLPVPSCGEREIEKKTFFFFL